MARDSRGLLAEGLLIVVSILVAFWIDAWWDERQDRVEEKRILNALRDEFLVNAEKIPSYMAGHQLSADYSAELIRTLHHAGPGGEVAVNVRHLGWTVSQSSTDPQSGALDTVLQSGELRYVRSPEVRLRLAAWPQLVVDATENEILLRHTWSPLYHAALARQADLAPLDAMDSSCWAIDATDDCDATEISVPYDTEVIGLLLPVRGYSSEAVIELGRLVEEAQRIVDLIDEELARDD